VSSTSLSKGGNAEVPTTWIRVIAGWRAGHGGGTPDLTGLLLGATGRVRSDDDMVFYNQPRHTSGAAHLESVGDSGVLHVNLAALGSDVAKVLLAVSVHERTFAGVAGLHVRVVDAEGRTDLRYDVTDADDLSAVVLGELYRRGSGWKFRAVGQGWAAGLAALAKAYGISVDDDETTAPPTRTVPTAPAAPPVPAAPPAPAAVPAPAAPMAAAAPIAPAMPTAGAGGEARLPIDMRKRLSMRKQMVNVVLTKKGLANLQARVILVLDASGSMTMLYSNGVVARVVERMAAVGARLTPDEVLHAWTFASNMAQLPPLTIGDLPGWIRKHVRGGELKVLPRARPLYRRDGSVDMREIGIQNEEPKVIHDIIRVVTSAPPGPPVLVLFFSDGGIYRDDEIEALIRDAAALPIFWQFVGLGREDYGVLEHLDTLQGRVVDNAGFFAVDDIERISDEELYERLLSEFPAWIRAASAAGIIR
jgi:stress response protein SCP2